MPKLQIHEPKIQKKNKTSHPPEGGWSFFESKLKILIQKKTYLIFTIILTFKENIMSFEIAGRLHKKYETESKTASFQAREFVIEVDGTYPNFIKFQLVQDRCPLLDNYNEGDSIKVYFDLRGREWQGKYFTNLNAWKLEMEGTSTTATPPVAAADGSFPTLSDAPAASTSTSEDDLPF